MRQLKEVQTKIADAFTAYVQALKEWQRSEKTEHTDRAAIQDLLRAFAELAEAKPKVQHERKRIPEKGRS